MKEVAQQESVRRAEEAKQWALENTVPECNLRDPRTGLIRIPTAWVVEPDPDIRARGLDESHVKTITQVIKTKTGVQENDLKLLSWSGDVRNAGLDPAVLTLDPKSKEPPFKMAAMAGLHSSTAVKRLNTKAPNNPKYMYLYARQWVICEKTDTNQRFARMYGNLSNLVAGQHKAQTMWDGINQMHTKRLGLVEKYGTHDCPGFRQEWKDARLDYEAMLPQSKPTIGSMMVLASYTGPTWNLIAKVFSGDVEEDNPKDKKFKPPTSAAYFNSMSDIPESLLNTWLSKIVTRQLECKDFHAKCLLFKKTSRVHKQIVDFVNAIRPPAPGESMFDNIDEIIEKYSTLNDPEWMRQMVTWCGETAKSPLHAEVKTAVRARIEACEEQAVLGNKVPA